MQKRHVDDLEDNETTKRSRVDEETSVQLVPAASSALVAKGPSRQGDNRTSGLQAPTMQLTGHSGPVYSLSFSPSGESLASAGIDGQIFLWEVYGECKNYNVLTGHKSAVLELKWTSSNKIVSASADKTVCLWDANSGRRERKFAEHTAIVNTCAIAKEAPHYCLSGSDDCTGILWDGRARESVCSLFHDYQVLASALSADAEAAYTGGVDNIIRKWDLRNTSEPSELLALCGHADSITGLSISPDGNHLLSNSMDHSMCMWDLRPFPSTQQQSRCERVFQGSTHGAEKCLLRCGWSPDQEQVYCGSADRHLRIWDASTAQVLYLLPGHRGSVNDVVYHPKEPIVASCSTDHQIFLGELC